MRISRAFGCVLLMLTVSVWADDFTLVKGHRPTSHDVPGVAGAQITIETSGTPPTSVTTGSSDGWEVRIYPKQGDPVVITSTHLMPEWRPPLVELRFAPDRIAGFETVDFDNAHMDVLFTESGITHSVSVDRPPAPAAHHLKAAKGKDDAAVYLFGSVLVGVGTKPIYVLDLKAAPSWERGNGWFVGTTFTFTANANVEAPVDRSRIDPDSTTGSLSLTHAFFLGNNGTGSQLGRFQMQLQPLRGEFTRKYPTSDLITAGSLRWTPLLYALNDSRRAWVSFYPAVGYELGKNLNTPDTLFKHSVDLRSWNAILRLVPSARTEFYLLRSKIATGDVYTLTMDATYQVRVPFANEPFVVPVRTGSTVTQDVLLRTNARHELEANLNWNLAKYTALTVKYRYGSLPPLFQFVDHQATIGLTFKAAQP